LWFVACLLAGTYRTEAGEQFPFGSNVSTQAQVFVVRDAQATEAFEPRADRVRLMVGRAITNLTGKSSVAAAWQSLVSTQDMVGIKVFSEPGPHSGTRPAVVAAVVEQLIAAGIPTNRIVVWDKRQSDLQLAGYFALGRRFGVRVAGSAEAGYDENAFYETALLGNLVWGDHEFGRKGNAIGRKSFVSRLVTEQITPLMNHNESGVCGNLFSLALGSVDNVHRFESDSGRLARAVPEIYALPALSDHVVLSIVDALVCQYEGEERSLLHYSTPFNELRFSRDPVALDVLSIRDLERERVTSKAPVVKVSLDLYHNASLLELGVSDIKRIEVVKVR
jgi:hypothetical protein